MYKILKAEKLADKIYLMDVVAPRVAKHCANNYVYVDTMLLKPLHLRVDRSRSDTAGNKEHLLIRATPIMAGAVIAEVTTNG